MEQIENISKLLTETKAQMDILMAQRKEINTKLNRLCKIKDECEASIILFGKYNTMLEAGTDFATLIADDNLRLMDGFDQKYEVLIKDSINDTKEQIRNAGIELLKRDEVMGAKERTINELAVVLTEQGDTETAEKIKAVAINEQIVEKL